MKLVWRYIGNEAGADFGKDADTDIGNVAGADVGNNAEVCNCFGADPDNCSDNCSL